MENSTQMVILTLPQVIDAALTGPEMGIVSYRLLNNILHVICQQLDLEEVKLQYRGIQAIQIQQIWNPDVKSKLPQITPVKRTKIINEENKEENIVVIPDGPSERFPAMTLAISNSQLHTMEKNIRSLQKDVSDLRALPSNSELFKAVKAKAGEPTPILDMYQILTVTKRMDATEQAVVKIASFVEDIAKYIQSESFGGLGEDFESMVDRPQTRSSSIFTDRRASRMKVPSGVYDKNKEPGIADASSEGERLRRSGSGAKYAKALDLGSLGNLASSAAKQEKTEHPLVMLKGTIGEEGFAEKRIKDKMPRDIRDSAQSSISKVESNSIYLPESKLKDINVMNMASNDVLVIVQDELKNLRSTVEFLCKMIAPGSIQGEIPQAMAPVVSFNIEDTKKPADVGSTPQPTDQKLSQIESKLSQCIGQINKMDKIFSNSYSGITNRMADIESSLKVLSNRALQDVGKADIEEQITQNIYSINERVLGLEGHVSKLSDTVAILLEDNNSKQNKLMNVVDDIDHLKSDKVGRDEFTEALSEKVDICMINRKVSHDQFNATCDDLSKGIEEALERLMEQEDLWHVALKEIQEEISEKLGKDDLSPLKEFVTDKLKGLQMKVKTLTRIKQEQEAAATKSKFLKGVQCISCDQDVMMRKKVDESVDYPGAPFLPPHKNLAPYLAYELDQMRRQQRQMQFGKNLHHFESATREAKSVVNRYCGGSHTITTPQQRVTRIGNFADQWGPKTIRVEKEDFQCQSDRTNEVTQKSSKDSSSARTSIRFNLAEKDVGGQVPKKTTSDILVQEKKQRGGT